MTNMNKYQWNNWCFIFIVYMFVLLGDRIESASKKLTVIFIFLYFLLYFTGLSVCVQFTIKKTEYVVLRLSLSLSRSLHPNNCSNSHMELFIKNCLHTIWVQYSFDWLLFGWLKLLQFLIKITLENCHWILLLYRALFNVYSNWTCCFIVVGKISTLFWFNSYFDSIAITMIETRKQLRLNNHLMKIHQEEIFVFFVVVVFSVW